MSLGLGPSAALSQALREQVDLQVRVARPGVLQRSGIPLSSDRDVARCLGREAVQLALDGANAVVLGPGAVLPFDAIRTAAMPNGLLAANGPDHDAVLPRSVTYSGRPSRRPPSSHSPDSRFPAHDPSSRI